MAREAPLRRLGPVVLLEVLGPEDAAARGVPAGEVSHRTDRVNLAVMNCRSAPRPTGVLHLVFAVILLGPDFLARLGVAANEAFLAGDWLFVVKGVVDPFWKLIRFFRDEVRDIDLAVGDGWAGVAVAARLAPEHLRPVLRELLENAGLAPHVVALRAHPLRPIFTARRPTDCGHRQSRQPHSLHRDSPDVMCDPTFSWHPHGSARRQPRWAGCSR